jgi:hypothetical protein
MGLTLANAPKPWRGYPNMNVMHGIRLMNRVGGAGVALTPAKLVPIGTVPMGAFLNSLIIYVGTAYGAARTLDIGANPDSAGTFAYTLATAASLATASAKLPQTLTFGYAPVIMEIYARLNGAVPTTGEVDAVLQFYVNQT